MSQCATSDFTVVLASCGLAHNDEDDLYLRDALEQVGVPAKIVLWDESEYDWCEPSLVLVRSTWDYVKDYSRFFSWASSINQKTLLMNPLSVLQWSSNKRYLLDIERVGGQIIPTIWLSQHQRDEAATIIQSALRKWGSIIMKPCVGAGSVGFSRINSLDEGLAHLHALVPSGEVMVQPFIRSFQEEGEYSLIFMGGVFSHAVRKFTRDLPVQKVPTPDGTRVEIADVVPKEAHNLAAYILEAMRWNHIFARIDVVFYQGQVCVNEIELIEPRLFLTMKPHSALVAARTIRDYLMYTQEGRRFSTASARYVLR